MSTAGAEGEEWRGLREQRGNVDGNRGRDVKSGKERWRNRERAWRDV